MTFLVDSGFSVDNGFSEAKKVKLRRRYDYGRGMVRFMRNYTLRK